MEMYEFRSSSVGLKEESEPALSPIGGFRSELYDTCSLTSTSHGRPQEPRARKESQWSEMSQKDALDEGLHEGFHSDVGFGQTSDISQPEKDVDELTYEPDLSSMSEIERPDSTSPLFVPRRGRSPEQCHNSRTSTEPVDERVSHSDEPSDPHSSVPLHQSAAHIMKMRMQAHDSVKSFVAGAPIKQRKRAPEHDPENHEIKRMRTEESMSWGDIARALNEERIKNGKIPSLTEAAVYGRFVRNGLRIAEANGEDFDPSDYMHLKNTKHKKQQSASAVPRFTFRDDEMLLMSYQEVQASFWPQVAERLESRCGKRYSAEACANRYHQI